MGNLIATDEEAESVNRGRIEALNITVKEKVDSAYVNTYIVRFGLRPDYDSEPGHAMVAKSIEDLYDNEIRVDHLRAINIAAKYVDKHYDHRVATRVSIE